MGFILLLVAVGVLLVGYGIGCLVLKFVGGGRPGKGMRARVIVALLLVACAVLTVYQIGAMDHPRFSGLYGRFMESAIAVLAGAAGIGLLCSLLLSFRSPRDKPRARQS